jgi:hypothetical protein
MNISFCSRPRFRLVLIALASPVLVMSIWFVWHRHQGGRSPWQTEAERQVKRDFPKNMSESHFWRVAKAKRYFLRKPKSQVVSVHVWAYKMKNPPGFPDDSVAVDVYFDPSHRIKGFSRGYSWRID